MFDQTASQEIDINNIKISLTCISDFINNRELKNNRKEDILFLKGFGQIAFNFVSSVFKRGWDQLKIDNNNKTFCKLIKNEFTIKVPTPNKKKKTNNSLPAKPVNFSKLLLSQLLPRLSKEVSEKSKFHEKNMYSKIWKAAEIFKPSYAQILSKNIDNILEIKENFSKLLNKKIKELNKSIFNKSDKPKPRINMMTKGPSHKQIIMLMSNSNANKFMTASSKYIANLNQTLRSIKSDLTINFIHIDH